MCIRAILRNIPHSHRASPRAAHEIITANASKIAFAWTADAFPLTNADTRRTVPRPPSTLSRVLQSIVDRRFFIFRIERIEAGFFLKLIAKSAACVELERTARLATITIEATQSLTLSNAHGYVRVDSIFCCRLSNVTFKAARITFAAQLRR